MWLCANQAQQRGASGGLYVLRDTLAAAEERYRSPGFNSQTEYATITGGFIEVCEDQMRRPEWFKSPNCSCQVGATHCRRHDEVHIDVRVGEDGSPLVHEFRFAWPHAGEID